MKYISFITLFFIFSGCYSSGKQTANELQEGNMKYALTPFSPVQVRLVVLQKPAEPVYAVIKTTGYVPQNRIESNDVLVDNAGTYLLDVKIDKPVKSTLQIGENSFTLMLTPGDTLDLQYHSADNLLEFPQSKTGKAISTYYAVKKERLGYGDIRMVLNNLIQPNATYKGLKSKIDSIQATEASFYKNYSGKDDLPAWFRDLEEAEIKYGGAAFKMSLPSYNRFFKIFSDSITNQYYDFLQNLQVNNSAAVFSPAYYSFLSGYFLKDLPDFYNDLSGFERSSGVRAFALPLVKGQLTGAVKQAVLLNSFTYMIRFYNSAEKIDSLATAHDIEDYEHFLPLAGNKRKAKTGIATAAVGKEVPLLMGVDLRDSLISIRDFRDKVVYINFWATWCTPCLKNMPELNRMITSMEAEKNLVFVNVCLDSKKEKWKVAVDKHELSGVNLFAEGKWSDKLRSQYDISGIPQYAILDKGNLLVDKYAEKAPSVGNRLQQMVE